MASSINPSPQSSPQSTPHATATPPLRRAASADPASGRLSASARRNNAATPHARAALRTLDQRRAKIFTPGKRRRSSLGKQRETPRDIMLELARVLGPKSTAVASSSSSSNSRRSHSSLPAVQEDDDDEDDFPIERPRFSLALDEDDDEDSELKPPRSSGLEDLDNYTAQSIEFPRRAWSEGPLGRLDRGSYGSIRMSDSAGPDLQSDDVGIDSGFFPPPALEDETGMVMLEDGNTLERLDAEEARHQTLGRESDFGLIQIPEENNESLFVMAPVESPVRDPTAQEVLDGIMELDHGPGNDDSDNVNQPADFLEEVEDDTVNNHIGDTLVSHTAELSAKRTSHKKNGKKISKHGIEYSSLPQGVVKKLTTTFAKAAGFGKAKLNPDTMGAIMQATDWFFEQLGDDLQAYAKHAGRKTIDESDMVTLLRRQRQTSSSTTPFALAQRYLPRELLQELRMPVPPPTKVPKRKSKHVDVDEEEEVT